MKSYERVSGFRQHTRTHTHISHVQLTAATAAAANLCIPAFAYAFFLHSKWRRIILFERDAYSLAFSPVNTCSTQPSIKYVELLCSFAASRFHNISGPLALCKQERNTLFSGSPCESIPDNLSIFGIFDEMLSSFRRNACNTRGAARNRVERRYVVCLSE